MHKKKEVIRLAQAKRASALIASIALLASGLPGFSAPAFAQSAESSAATSTSALILPEITSATMSPTSGSLGEGDRAEVTLRESHGLSDLSVKGGCSINGKDASGSFQNLGDGYYKLSYTVDREDAERAAGAIPFSCVLGNESGSVEARSPWQDGNTLSIDINDDGSTVSSGLEASLSPWSGMLDAGDTLTLTLKDPLGAEDLHVGAAGCTLNGVDVSSSFEHVGGGYYKASHIIGASDTERASGQIPVDCSVESGSKSARVVSFNDGNTAGIDISEPVFSAPSPSSSSTEPSEEQDSDAPAFAMFALAATSPNVGVYMNPPFGTLEPGDFLEVYIQDEGDNATFSSGACTVNGVDVAPTFENLGSGYYRYTYTVGANDASRAAGEVPIDCTLTSASASNSPITIDSFTDGNTVSIAAGSTGGNTGGNGGDTGGNGTSTPSTLINEVSLVPETGTMILGRTLDTYFEAAGGATDITLNGACTVNGVDVSTTFENLASGLYRVKYTVGASDSDRAAGQIPVSCALKNSSGGTQVVSAYTDGNSTSIDVNDDGTGTGGNTGGNGGDTGSNGTSTPSISFSSVYVNPSSGVRYGGEHVLVYLQSSTSATDLSLGGSCKVNGVSVSPLENLGGGTYRLDYTVGSSDPERAAGTLPITCSIQSSSNASTTVSAFTDGNTLAIDTDHDGTVEPLNENSTTTPMISWISVTPSSGTLTLGQSAQVYFQEAENQVDLSIGDTCEINEKAVTMLDNLGAGLYRLNYTVAESDIDRAAGELPISCELVNGAGLSTTTTQLSPNTLAIDVDGDGDFTDGHPENGVLAVDSITQVRSTAVAGGGYENGWEWVFDVTVPLSEKMVRVKFGDWNHASASTTIPMAGNMRVSSAQASSTAPVAMTAAGIYSDPLEINGDFDQATPGRQIKLRVEMQVPTGTQSGSYGTYYGIQSSEE